jgi:hypothetical protein
MPDARRPPGIRLRAAGAHREDASRWIGGRCSGIRHPATATQMSPPFAPRAACSRQQPVLRKTKPLPHSFPGRSHVEPPCFCGPQMGRKRSPPGPLATSRSSPRPVILHSIFACFPRTPSNRSTRGSTHDARAGRKNKAQSLTRFAVPFTSGARLSPPSASAGEGGRQPGRPSSTDPLVAALRVRLRSPTVNAHPTSTAMTTITLSGTGLPSRYEPSLLFVRRSKGQTRRGATRPRGPSASARHGPRTRAPL